MSHDVFISYAVEDKAMAEAVCEALESEGVLCWIAPRDIPSGSKWEQSIVEALGSCRAMVLVFSEHATRSEHVEREVGQAFANGTTVIPFRISNADLSPILRYYLRQVQWLDASSGSIDIHLRSLAVHVRNLLSENESGVSSGGIVRVFRDSERRLLVALRRPLEVPSLSLTLDFGVTKGLLGPSSNPSGQRGFHNKENTLFGVNHQPCTKASNVHLFIFTGANFDLINDVNVRVAQLLDEPFSKSALYFLRIEAIEGDVVKLQTVDFSAHLPYPRLEFTVRVTGDATFRLVS